MDVLLLANRSTHTLDRLAPAGNHGLLPVAGRPLLDLALDELVSAGISRCSLAVSQGSLEVKRHLESGDLWGIQVDYLLSKQNESAESILERFQTSVGTEVLIIDVTGVGDSVLPRFLELAQGRKDARRLLCRANGRPVGIELLRRASTQHPFRAESAAETIDLAGAHRQRILSPSDLYTANVRFSDASHPKIHLNSDRVRPGLSTGTQSDIPRSAQGPAEVLSGARCLVHQDARLEGRVVLSDDVMVDAGVRLRDVVVLPGTYIPAHVEIEDALVSKGTVIPCSSAGWSSLAASEEACDLNSSPIAEWTADAANRAAGLLLLLLSLPLWPIALLLATARAGGGPFERFAFIGRKRALDESGTMHRPVVTGWRLRTSAPILRDLPLLLSVVRGDLRLVGVRPRMPSPRSAEIPSWQRRSSEAPPGLLTPRIGLEQGDLSGAVGDAVYAVHPSRSAVLAATIRAFVSPRAWRPSR